MEPSKIQVEETQVGTDLELTALQILSPVQEYADLVLKRNNEEAK